MLKAKIKELEYDAAKAAELLLKEQRAKVNASSRYKRAMEENMILKTGESKFEDGNNFSSVSARYFEQSGNAEQAPVHHGQDWYYKKDQSFWRLIVRAVDRRGRTLSGLLLDESKK